MDETTLSLHPPLAKCWMKRGEQKQIPTPGTQENCHVFGAWDWHQDKISWTVAANKHSIAFSDFIEYLLLERYPNDRIVLVMDNASFHHSYHSCATLACFDDRLLLFWLPPCSDQFAKTGPFQGEYQAQTQASWMEQRLS